jgi:hypothetical protein
MATAAYARAMSSQASAQEDAESERALRDGFLKTDDELLSRQLGAIQISQQEQVRLPNRSHCRGFPAGIALGAFWVFVHSDEAWSSQQEQVRLPWVWTTVLLWMEQSHTPVHRTNLIPL